MTGRMDNDAFAATVQHIRDRFPLPGVATKAGVKLARAGREWKGCCPFHHDKSPSFIVFGDDRRGHCFGCGWSGDVIDFVIQAYGVKTREAIGMLDGGALRELEQQRVACQAQRVCVVLFTLLAHHRQRRGASEWDRGSGRDRSDRLGRAGICGRLVERGARPRCL